VTDTGEAVESLPAETVPTDSDATPELAEPPAEPVAEEDAPVEPAAPAEPVAAPEAEDALVASAPDAAFIEAPAGSGVSWLPFALYFGSWVALVGATAYLLQGATPESPARWMPAYRPIVIAGLALAVAGPVVSLVAWLVARNGTAVGDRRGLFASAFTRGALAAFSGALIWLACLFLLELVANGTLR